MRTAALPLALLVLLAGCSSPGSPSEDTGLGEDIDVTVTETTGAIRGVVVDEAIRPLAGAIVRLNAGDGQREANTTDTGGFAFSDLEPGTYFLQASKFGFSSIQAQAEVVAGDEDPDVVRIQLVRDPSQVAYYTPQSQTGFILCTTSFVAVCGAPNIVSELVLCDFFDVCLGNVTSDRFGFYLFYEPNATMIQAEMAWDSTQSLSTQLSLSMENIEGCEADSNAYVEGVSGDSPIYNIANETDIEDGTIGGTCGIWYSVFSGDTAGTPLGVTVQQKFEIFSHEFHGYTPPEGWRFTEGGQPPNPPS